MEKEIIVKPSFTFKDYFKANLYIYLTRPAFIIISVVVFLIILVNVTNIFSNEVNLKDIFTSSFVFILLYPLLIIYSIYRHTKRIFKNPRLNENLSIHFNENYMEEVGDSFNMKFFWKDLKKITEKKDWFLIYLEKNSAKVLNKSDLKNNQYNELKQLFNSIDIKKSLKS
ncbi:MAG: YcxB family protein [Flavobacterium sp.]|uniref:YcxB-like C-terminal domain-containing protein n=1 Tax=Flavobacterium plurextorum TaxID=1114867 RepID=A0ABX4CV10_9FLAO|nr:YcxB family protein [Flavobacterium plurextorum]OXB07202.1 hypothetical protein B0A81_12090 [Flavobacterium plurextorum]